MYQNSILDDKPRDGLSMKDGRFLQEMGSLVMEHLEMLKARAEQRRGTLMVKALNSFMENEPGTRDEPARPPAATTAKTLEAIANATEISNSQLTESSEHVIEQLTLQHKLEDENALLATGRTLNSLVAENNSPSPTISENVRPPLSRRDSSKLDASMSNCGELADESIDVTKPGREPDLLTSDTDGAGSATDTLERSKDSEDVSKPCSVFGASYGLVPANFSPPHAEVPKKLLQSLLRCHKHGKVFLYGAEGDYTSDTHTSDGSGFADSQLASLTFTPNRNSKDTSFQKRKRSTRSALGKKLGALFPQARSLMLLGLWNMSRDRWDAGCIVYSNSPIRVFSVESEMCYLKAFCDVITAKIGRLDVEMSHKVKSDFMSSISHELRSPLHGILGTAEFVHDQVHDSETSEMISQIQVCGQTLLDVVDHLLDFSKVEAGKLNLEIVPFDFAALIDAQADLLAGRAQQKGLKLQVKVDSQLPASLLGDPGRIAQVVLNLLSNAIKFTEGGVIEVDTAVQSTDATIAQVRVSVKDQGIGISSASQKTLFQAFTQADSTTARRYGGTGLGLSISKRLIDLMGGQIGVASKLGYGATFWFVVPLQIDTGLAKAPLLSSVLGDLAAPVEPLNWRILVVEDNAVNQLLTSTMLKTLGCTVHTAADGREALDSVTRVPYDLVLMDCQMPGMDGYQATRAIRERETGTGRHLPIIALTANAMQEDARKCLAAGMDAYLTKPIKKAKLSETLQHWLGSSRCEKQGR
ncbi:MAG: response regulator [Cytophagaceae bacterium]|nr:MAG: response regulator [Cytophagaceae bacterium]